MNDFIRKLIIIPSKEIRLKLALRGENSRKLKLGDNGAQSRTVDL